MRQNCDRCRYETAASAFTERKWICMPPRKISGLMVAPGPGADTQSGLGGNDVRAAQESLRPQTSGLRPQAESLPGGLFIPPLIEGAETRAARLLVPARLSLQPHQNIEHLSLSP